MIGSHDFSFKPALLRGRSVVSVDSRVISLRAGRRCKTFNWSDVRDIHVYATNDGLMEYLRLEIIAANGKMMNLSSGTYFRTRQDELRTFKRAAAAILRAYAASRPGADVALGPSRRRVMGMKALMVVAAMAGSLAVMLGDGRITTTDYFLPPVVLVLLVFRGKLLEFKPLQRVPAAAVSQELSLASDAIIQSSVARK